MSKSLPSGAPLSSGDATVGLPDSTLPLASIIIPTLNEERYIGELLGQLLDHAPSSVKEILVADGGSHDATREIVKSFAERDSRVSLIYNLGRIQAVGVNVAARAMDPRSDVIIRIDAHAIYSDDFIAKLLTEMARPELDSVVVRMRTEGTTCFQRAVAIVSNSSVGTGGSVHRTGTKCGYVDHGHHAAIRRKTFLGLGGYDEAFATNEDAEFDHRLTSNGGRIWLSEAVEVRYVPRATPAGLARQYFKYGSGRAQNLIKHRTQPRARQLAPVLLTLYLLASVPLALLVSPLVLLPLVAYVTVLAGFAASALMRHKSACAIGICLALPIMHVGWGLGFLMKAVRTRLGRRDPTDSVEKPLDAGAA